MWIVTREIHEHHQDGSYFEAAFSKRPTFRQLKDVLKLDDVTTGKLTRGGGRHTEEHEWYYLIEVSDGSKGKLEECPKT